MRDNKRLEPPPRVLPRTVRPFPNETIQSYVERLSRANRIRPALIHALVRARGRDQLANLAALSGVAAHVLALAIPDLVDDQPATGSLRGLPRTPSRAACRRCAVRHSPDHVYPLVSYQHDDVLCAKHRMWIGSAATPYQQLLLGGLYPELSRAARQHRRLIRDLGRPVVLRAYEDAREVALAYADRGLLPERVRERGRILRDQVDCLSHGTVLEASSYPSTVALTTIFINLPRGKDWQSLSPQQVDSYRNRIRREITGHYTPTGAYDAFFRMAARPSSKHC